MTCRYIWLTVPEELRGLKYLCDTCKKREPCMAGTFKETKTYKRPYRALVHKEDFDIKRRIKETSHIKEEVE